jgi:hypothetical protein
MGLGSRDFLLSEDKEESDDDMTEEEERRRNCMFIHFKKPYLKTIKT